MPVREDNYKLSREQIINDVEQLHSFDINSELSIYLEKAADYKQ